MRRGRGQSGVSSGSRSFETAPSEIRHPEERNMASRKPGLLVAVLVVGVCPQALAQGTSGSASGTGGTGSSAGTAAGPTGAYGAGANGGGAFGPAAYGAGAYGGGAFGPGAYGAGAYGAGSYRRPARKARPSMAVTPRRRRPQRRAPSARLSAWATPPTDCRLERPAPGSARRSNRSARVQGNRSYGAERRPRRGPRHWRAA